MKYNPYCKVNTKTITVPNQSLSVKQILDRFTRGQSLPVGMVSSDDPQGLSDEDHMSLHQCEDDFERRDLLIGIEEGRLFTSRQSEASETKRSGVKSASRRREENSDPEQSIDNGVEESENGSENAE